MFVLGVIEEGCEGLDFLQKLVPTLNREGHNQGMRMEPTLLEPVSCVFVLQTRQLTHLHSSAAMRTFDVTRDGRSIVFDRLRENSDIVLIDLPRKQGP